MIINNNDSTISYRCPSCGGWATGNIGFFSLSAEMIKLKCSCGGSELVGEQTKDGKIRLRVPCFFCPNPHNFTMSKSMFLNREIMSFPCDYSGIDICITGEKEAVAEACADSDDELLALLGEDDYSSFSEVLNSDEKTEYLDPQVTEIVSYVIKDLDESGEITCKCPEDEGLYVVEQVSDGFVVRCENCDCSVHLPITSTIQAQSFLDCAHLDLK